MKRAVRDYNLAGNPVKQIDKPSQRRDREPVLVTVEQVETMRLWCLRRDDLRSATLIALLAYAGPRPESEALPLPWSGIRRHTILFRATKRGVPYAGLRAGKSDGAHRVRPRDLRSSFATLLIYEGQPPQYVAAQLGHSAATLLRDYARVWEDFDPSQRVSAEEQIERVRGRLERTLARPKARHARRPRAASGAGVPRVFRDLPAAVRTENAGSRD
jgi:integrase